MGVLDRISRDILLLLLRTGEPQASRSIAEKLGISKRMYRYRQDTIENWLRKRGIDLIVRRNYGVKIDATEYQKRTLIKEIEQLSGYSLVLSQKERIQLLILHLLLNDEPQKSDVLCGMLEVSRTTLYKDLNKVENWFSNYQIHLQKTPRVGIYLEGDEFTRRIVLEDFLVEILGEIPFLDLCYGTSESIKQKLKGKVALLHEVCEFLEKLALQQAIGSVKKIEEQLAVQLTDNSYSSLVFQIALTNLRIKQGQIVERDISIENSDFDALVPLVSNVLEDSVKLSGKSIPPGEINFLIVQLLCSQRRYSVFNILDYDRAIEESTLLREIMDNIIGTASAYLHPALQSDQQLYQSLIYHLKPALNRLNFRLPIRNPILEEIQERYPYIHKVARMSCVFLSSRIGRVIPENEIGKITLQLASAMERLRNQNQVKKKVIIVCGEGITTAWLVVSRLNAVFPEIEVLEIMSRLEVSRRRVFPGNMDGMISTVPLDIPGVPIVTVSPMLSGKDQEEIKKVFQIGRDPGEVISSLASQVSLAELIIPEHIQVNVHAENWKDVVARTGNLLFESGTVKAKYIKAMIAAIEKHGPYVVILPGVALLHARPEQGVNSFGLSVITLKEPVEFGYPDHDPVDISIALAAVDNHSHVRALMELIEVLRDKSTLEKIRGAREPFEVSKIIHNALQYIQI